MFKRELLAQNRLAAFLYFTCLGRLFMQAGEEFARTKLGDGNSYRSSPELNMLSWERAAQFSALTDYYRQLIRLRKSLPLLCDKSSEAWDRVTAQTIHRPKVVSFQVEGGGARLLIICNAADGAFSLPLSGGGWVIRADGQCADQHTPADGPSARVPAHSGMLLQQTSR